MKAVVVGTLALLALVQGQLKMDLDSSKKDSAASLGSESVLSSQLQGIQLADDDDFGKGPIGPAGHLSRASSINAAPPTYANKMAGVVPSNQINGFSLSRIPSINAAPHTYASKMAGVVPSDQNDGSSLTRIPPINAALPTYAGKMSRVVSSDQLQAFSLSGTDDWFGSGSSSQLGQKSTPLVTKPPPPPPPPPREVKMLTMDEMEKRFLSSAEYEEKHPPSQGDLSMLGKFSTDPYGKEHLSTYEGVTKHIKLESRKVSAYNTSFNDPLWGKEWYLQDYRTTDMVVMDMNTVPVWNMGITGKGIYVAVVDDGVVHDHPDLAANHDKELSFDYCKNIPGSQPDPPKKSSDEDLVPDSKMHGTKCAGEIAMVANNGICGVGVAYGVKIVGVKTLGERTQGSYNLGDLANSYQDGKGLVHELNKIDISSNSYGPRDDGKYGQLMTDTKAKYIEMGIKEGRNKKGMIYLVASGNGKVHYDMCGADASVNHIGVIAISAASQGGLVTDFGERCSAVFAATYSEGNARDEYVTTIDMNGDCTTKFGGTSAATPIASGIVALVLEAAKKKGKQLSYRDVMHIISMGAEVAPLADNKFRGEGSIWMRNGAGFWVSSDFGFGLLNAKNMVKLAEEWQNVPEMHTCQIPVHMDGPLTANVGSPATIEFPVHGCEVKWLESVQLQATVDSRYRGAIEITLTSPAGTMVYVMESRNDDNSADMKDWVFKSVHSWGENPEGKWKIQVISVKIFGVPDTTGYAKSFRLTVHGLTGPPPHQPKLPRSYSAFRLTDGKTSHDNQR